MSLFLIGATLLTFSVALVAYSLYKQEEKEEAAKRKMATARERFINK
tara:strand:+ start:269 stop:409 length:141 start_codon:yes stop_codon:yes gene_type:complete